MTRPNAWGRWIAAIAMAGLSGWAISAQQKPASADVLLGRALHQEQSEGQYEAAIATYRQLLKAPDATREQQARAQFRIGVCYEQLGNSEARKAYEEVLRAFADQAELAALARTRLAQIGSAAVPAADSPVIRQVHRSDESYTFPVASPDGRYLALTEDHGWPTLTDIRTGEVRSLAPKDASALGVCDLSSDLAWSRDSARVAYGCHTDDRGWHIRVGGADGGPHRVLIGSKDGMRVDEVHDWSPDGQDILILAGHRRRATSIALVSVEDGSVRVLKQFDPLSTGTPKALRFSPDGRFIAYDRGKTEDPYDRDVFVLSVNDGTSVEVSAEPTIEQLIGWAPDGSGVVFLSDNDGRQSLWLRPVASGRPTEKARILKDNVGDVFVWTARIATTGSVFYSVRGGSKRTLYEAEVDMSTGIVSAAPTPVTPASSFSQDVSSWSPNGSTLAFLPFRLSEGAGTTRMLALVDTRSRRPRQITMPIHAMAIYGVTWSADGKSVFVNGHRPSEAVNEDNTLFRIDIETGDATEVTTCRPVCTPTPDGATVYDLARERVTARNVATGVERLLYTASPTSYGLYPPRLSPDGQWLALRETERGQQPPGATGAERAAGSTTRLKIVSTAGGEARVVYTAPVGASVDVDLGWSSDSRHLIFQSESATWHVPIEGGSPTRLNLGLERAGGFSAHPDGRRLAFYVHELEPSETWALHNVLPPAPAKSAPTPRQSQRR